MTILNKADVERIIEQVLNQLSIHVGKTNSGANIIQLMLGSREISRDSFYINKDPQ